MHSCSNNEEKNRNFLLGSTETAIQTHMSNWISKENGFNLSPCHQHQWNSGHMWLHIPSAEGICKIWEQSSPISPFQLLMYISTQIVVHWKKGTTKTHTQSNMWITEEQVMWSICKLIQQSPNKFLQLLIHFNPKLFGKGNNLMCNNNLLPNFVPNLGKQSIKS